MGIAETLIAIKQPMLRAISGGVVVWLPAIIVINAFLLGDWRPKTSDFIAAVVAPPMWVAHAVGLIIFLAVGLLLGAFLTAAFSLVYFCFSGHEGYVSFQFCVFVAFLMLSIVPLLVASWFFKSKDASQVEERKKWGVAVFALAVFNTFGFLFTVRDIIGLVASIFG